jgi:hypothetical protein
LLREILRVRQEMRDNLLREMERDQAEIDILMRMFQELVDATHTRRKG